MHDNNSGYGLDGAELKRLLKEQCTLNQSYFCANKSLINTSNVGFYYSTVYLIARSNALFYVPGLGDGGKSLDSITVETAIIDLDSAIPFPSNMDNHYASRMAVFVNQYKTLMDMYSADASS
jgi:hypothetical protein